MRKVKWIFMAVALVIICGLAAGIGSAQPKTDAIVKLSGIRIVGDGYGKKMSGIRAFNWSRSTTLAVLVVVPQGGLIAFDDKVSKLDVFTDDKRTDLKLGKGFTRAGIQASSFSISKDGKACMVEIQGPGVPAQGATQIIASGKIAFKCGSKQKTFTHKNLLLKPGTKINAGPVAFTLTATDKPQWGKDPLQITLTAEQDCSAIAKVRFLDAAGQEIKSRYAGGMRQSSFGKFKVEKNYSLARKIESVTIEITYWMDTKQLMVPFSLKTTVGI